MIRKPPFLMLILLASSLLLSSCIGEVQTFAQPAQQAAPEVTFTSFPTSMAVLVTDTPQPSPQPTQTGVPTPLPQPPDITVTAQASPTKAEAPKTAIKAQSTFQDCARTPGLGQCDPQAPAGLTGRLTFADGQANRLVTVDLATGTGWQTQMLDETKKGLFQMYWSPEGDKLMGFFDPGIYTLWGKDGAVLQNGNTNNYPPQWQPDDTLSLDGTVVSTDGRTARLEAAPDTSWHLLITDQTGGKPKDLIITQPTDQIFSLRGWVPDAGLLLAQVFNASNSATLIGGGLVTIDAENGAIQPLNATAPLLPGGDFTWNPQNQPLLAFLLSGLKEMTARTIGLYDFSTNQLRTPLSDQVSVSGLAWSPDGSQLAFSATPMEGAAADVKSAFPGPGVYLLDVTSGKVSPVLQTPQGASDGWLHWTADGKAIFYARAVVTGSGSQTELRLHPLDGGQDRVLINGIATPQSAPDAAWYSILAYAPAQP